VLQDVPEQQPVLAVETGWKWVACHKPIKCQSFACPVGQKEIWAKDEVYVEMTEQKWEGKPNR